MRGSIEGYRARQYAENVKKSKKSKIFNRFILNNVKGKSLKICDLCSGPGNNIELLMNKSKEIVGVDVSTEMIKISKGKFNSIKKVKLHRRSVTNTSLKSNYFDYVIIRMGLHHVKDKEKVLEEAHRILKPKGKFIIIDKSYLNLPHFFWKSLIKHIRTGVSIFHEYMVSEKDYMRILKASEFKITKKTDLPYDPESTGQSFMIVLQKA